MGNWKCGSVLCLLFIVIAQAAILPVFSISSSPTSSSTPTTPFPNANANAALSGNLPQMPSPPSSSSAASSASSASGAPLQPGTVIVYSSNSSVASSSSSSTSEPLRAVQNWTINEQIPTVLFHGQPISYVNQSYTFSAGGAFRAYDSQNDSLSWTGLTGLPPGTLFSYMVANSTKVVQTFIVLSGGKIAADVSVVYSALLSSGYYAGLEITINGNANWGTAGHGTVGLKFAQKPSLIASSSVWSINSSANASALPNQTALSQTTLSQADSSTANLPNTNGSAGMCFDWSDSLTAYPACFSNVTNSVKWAVPGTFSIDPKIIANSSAIVTTGYDFETKVIDANGRVWAFFLNASGYTGSAWYSSSADMGITWAAPTLTPSLPYGGSGYFFGNDIAATCQGNTVYLVVTGMFTSDFLLGVGSLNANGNITWSVWEPVTILMSQAGIPSVCVDGSGNVYVYLTSLDYINNGWLPVSHVYEAAPPYTSFSSKFYESHTYSMFGPLLMDSKALVLLRGSGAWGIGATWSLDNGTTWNTTVWTSVYSYDIDNSQAVLIGDTVYVVAANNSVGVYFLSFNLTSGTWSTPQLLDGSAVYAGIATDGISSFDVYLSNLTTITSRTSFDLGKSWTQPALISSTENTAEYISMCPQFDQGYALGVWTDGTSSPYSIMFAATPMTVQNAANSPNEWSKPGLSPYEDYFTSESGYVSPGNGLLGIEQTDYSLSGRGLDLAITRVYSTPYAFVLNSTYMYDNYTAVNLGIGWQLSLPWFGQNYFHLWDGQVYPYNWSGNVFENHNGENFKLVNNNNGSSYDLYTVSGTDYHFDSMKRLVSINDTNGNAISISYNNYSEISTMTDTVGRNVTFAYNGNRQLSASVTGEGNFTYSYSGSNLIAVTDPLNRTTSYQYNTGINSWLVSRVAYPTGAYTNYTYGSAAAGTEATTYYVTLQNVYASGTALSRSSNFSYVAINGIIQQCTSSVSNGSSIQGYVVYNFTAPSKTVMTDENQTGSTILSCESDYDSYGRVNVTKVLSPLGAVLANSSSQFDNWGNVIYSADYNGHQSWYSYSNTATSGTFPGSSRFTNSFYNNSGLNANIHDLLLGQAQYQNGTGSARMETYFQYDAKGNLIQQKQLHSGGWILSNYSYDSYGNLASETNPLNSTTYYQYSPAYKGAYLTSQSVMVGSQNVTTTYTYNFTNGAMLSTTDPMGNTTTYKYDKIGRTISVSFPLVMGVIANETYYCNDTGNYIVITDPDGSSVRQVFDGLERLIQVIAYNGSQTYSTENFTYNWLGEVSTETQPSGSAYSYGYDSLGKQTSVTNPDGTTAYSSYNYTSNVETMINEAGQKTQYGYDWAGHLLWVKQYYNATSFYQTNYTYDQSGNPLSVKDANGRATMYKYDDLNRLVLTTYPNGANQSMYYDNAGNLIAKTDQNRITINYTYDALSRLTQIRYPDGTTVNYTYDKDGNRLSDMGKNVSSFYQYDARNRLVNETDVINGTSYATLYTYDKAGNILSIKYPDSTTLSYHYDPLERVSSVGGYANFTYNVVNEISTIKYANNVTTAYQYDSRGRPTRILVSYNGTSLMDLNYTYDSIGNVLKIDGENYSYDMLNRLISGSGSWGLCNYSYDPAGNMLTFAQNGSSTSFTYGSNNQLTRMGSVNFTYDSDGNMLTKVNGSAVWHYGYDYEDRLVNVILNSNLVQTNLYTSDGQRVMATDKGSSSIYVYEGSAIIYEKNLTSGQVTDRFYANGLQIADLGANSTVQYLHEDALGSIRLVTSSTRNITFGSNYAPFGRPVNATGINEFQYTDKPIDAFTGLYYFGARFYDPSILRFITADSRVGSPSDPLSLNRYIYARDNPETIMDPTGHGWWGDVTGAVLNVGIQFVSKVSSDASAIMNAWNSLPPGYQDAITIGVTVALTVATCGVAAAPLMLGAGLAMGAGGMGVYAGYQVATGGTITAEGLADSFTQGFCLGTMAAGAAPALSEGLSVLKTPLTFKDWLEAAGYDVQSLTRDDIWRLSEKYAAEKLDLQLHPPSIETPESFHFNIDGITQDGKGAYEIKEGNQQWSSTPWSFSMTQARQYAYIAKNNVNGIEQSTYVFIKNPLTGLIGYGPNSLGYQWLFCFGIRQICLR